MLTMAEIKIIIEKRMDHAENIAGVAYCEDGINSCEAQIWRGRYLELVQLLEKLETIK